MKPKSTNLLKKYILTICPVPGIGPISAAVIYSEYGDISNFSKSRTDACICRNRTRYQRIWNRISWRQNGKTWFITAPLRSSSTACLPLIRFDMTFAAYYAKKRAEGKPHRVAITHVAKEAY